MRDKRFGAVLLMVLALALPGCSSMPRLWPSAKPTPKARVLPRRAVVPRPAATLPATVAIPLQTPTPPPPPELHPSLAPAAEAKLEAETRQALAAAEQLLADVTEAAPRPESSGDRSDRIAILRGLVGQARAAVAQRDWQRGYTMATKAQVIGRDLAEAADR